MGVAVSDGIDEAEAKLVVIVNLLDNDSRFYNGVVLRLDVVVNFLRASTTSSSTRWPGWLARTVCSAQLCSMPRGVT